MENHFVNEIYEQIWNDRYRKNGESYEDNLKRVAKFISGAEKEDEECWESIFLEVMKNNLFFPAGRTMSNSGIGRDLTLNNCFLKGTKVLTNRGLVNIEDVKIGDSVISEDNKWHKVVNTLNREYHGDIYKLSGGSLWDDIYCTPNHKFLTQNGWVRADELICKTSKDNHIHRLKVPSLKFKKQYSKIDLTNYYEQNGAQRIRFEKDDKICIEKFCQRNRHNNTVNWMKVNNSVNRYIDFTEDFRYFIGRWIGDGSVTKYKGKENHSIVQIVFNAKKEYDAAKKCFDVGNKIFGLRGEWRLTEQNVIAIRWANEILATFFYKEFGEKCYGKYLSDKYIGDIEIAKGLIDADGTIFDGGSGKVVLKNRQIVEWLRTTMFLNGYNTHKVKKIKNLEETYMVDWTKRIGNKGLNQSLMKEIKDIDKNYNVEEISNYIVLKSIEIIKNQSCKVYNISVENVHSYVANGVVVANCFVAPQIKDSLTDIFSKVKLGAMTHQKGGGIGFSFSEIRPKGMPTSNDAIASGPVSFMDVFDAQTATILQGGRRK